MPDKHKTAVMLRTVDHCHGRKLLSVLNKHRQNSHPTCDLVICSSDGTEFLAHKAIAAAACPYFDGLLSSKFIESLNARVTLPFSNAVVAALLNHMYSGEIQLTSEIVLELLYATDFLMVDNLKGPIVNFICADVMSAFSETNLARLGLEVTLVAFSILKYYVADGDVIATLADLLAMAVEDKSCESENDDISEPSDSPMRTLAVSERVGRGQPSGTCAFRIFSNKLYKFDGFGWSRVVCPEFNEKAPSLKSFAVVNENGKFLYQTQEELRLFEMDDQFCVARSPSDRSMKPFQEEIVSSQANRLCFSENMIIALFAGPQQSQQQLHVWNDFLQTFQVLGDIWPLSVTYLDYIFEDSVQGKSRLFIVGNFKTLADEIVANSIFCFNICPLTGFLLSYKSIPVLPYINNSYIYHHFDGKLIAIPRTIGRNFCKDFYVFDENSAIWRLWDEAKLKVESRTILDVVSTRDSLYLIMSNFDHRWQNEFVQWNGHEFTDVTFSTSIPIEGKLLERISWIDYNVVNKVLQKARGLWL